MPPLTVLREQAQLLTQATEGLVQGKVSSDSLGDGRVVHSIEAHVPALGGYAVQLIRASHATVLYPCRVWTDFVPNSTLIANDKEQLEIASVQLLSHDSIQQVVASLMVQATAE